MDEKRQACAFEVANHFEFTLTEKQLEGFISWKDIFVSLLMDYGKSLIYAVLPLAFNRG